MYPTSPLTTKDCIDDAQAPSLLQFYQQTQSEHAATIKERDELKHSLITISQDFNALQLEYEAGKTKLAVVSRDIIAQHSLTKTIDTLKGDLTQFKHKNDALQVNIYIILDSVILTDQVQT